LCCFFVLVVLVVLFFGFFGGGLGLEQKRMILKRNKILLQQSQEIIRLVRTRCTVMGELRAMWGGGGRRIVAYIPLQVCQVFQIERPT